MSDNLNEEKLRILSTPINKLGLNLESSDFFPFLNKLYKELSRLGIKFNPKAYLTDDWGCPDGVPIIGVPFYITSSTLRDVEINKIGIIETDEEVSQILRHEAGLAFIYAYELYKLPKWKEIFGVHEKSYSDNFAPVVGSGKFVRYLEGWYAQKHPDEDFAETFAVLLTPGLHWKKIYRKSKAFEKLLYTQELINQYKNLPPIIIDGKLDVPVEEINDTINDWYKKRTNFPESKQKILILFYQEYPKSRPVHDEVVDHVKEVLLDLKYEVSLLPINHSIEKIINVIKQEKPDLIFNLCETFRRNDRFDSNITALIEMLNIPFTGSSSGSLFLSNDKIITKKLFDYHKIPYADFIIFPIEEKVVVPDNIVYPRFVKPVHEDASIGIENDSVVFNKEELFNKINQIRQNLRDDVLVEEYIDGREFFVAMLGSKEVKPLEIIEVDFSAWPKEKKKIYTYTAKINEESDEFKLIDFKLNGDIDISQQKRNEIYDIALKVFKSLGVRDYCRIDMRLDSQGKIYVMEANLNPYLAKEDMLAMAGESSGFTYKNLISHIVDSALNRGRK